MVKGLLRISALADERVFITKQNNHLSRLKHSKEKLICLTYHPLNYIFKNLWKPTGKNHV